MEGRKTWSGFTAAALLALSVATAQAPITLPAGFKPLSSLEEQLIAEEGLRLKVYKDSRGHATIGVGHLLSNGLTLDQVLMVLRDDIEKAQTEIAEALPWTIHLGANQRNALATIAFTTGIGGLLEFEATLSALKAGDNVRAKTLLLSSKWRHQVGEKRALRIANALATG